MKKLTSVVLVCICIFGLMGCNPQLQQPQETQQPPETQQPQGNPLFPEGNIVQIDVSSLPEGYNYSFRGEDATAIVDYLSDLSLESEFEENPDEYVGLAWVISLEYENGDILEVHHFCNMFIRAVDGSVYKMDYDEASRFDTLLYELSD